MSQLDYLLTRELDGRLETLVDGLSKGAPADYPEYCKLVGEIRGLRYGLTALANIRQKVDAEDE